MPLRGKVHQKPTHFILPNLIVTVTDVNLPLISRPSP